MEFGVRSLLMKYSMCGWDEMFRSYGSASLDVVFVWAR